MKGDLQYDYIEHLHGREAADQWLQKKKLEEIRKQNIINQYAPPLVSPDQMVRAAQKAVGTIPGGLLSEEGSGQMVPLTEKQRIMDERERALAEAYTTPVPSQQDMWKSQAHSMSPNYLAQDSESVELPSHHAIHGGGYPIPPPQSAETLSSIHERGFIPFSGESIPFDHPSIAGESIPVTMAMHEQMIPGLHKYFGGGHPDEISLTQARQHYGYDQFSRPRGLLDSEPSDDNQVAYQALLNEVPSPVKTTGRTGKGWESQREFDPNNRRRYNPAWAAMITGGLDLAFD